MLQCFPEQVPAFLERLGLEAAPPAVAAGLERGIEASRLADDAGALLSALGAGGGAGRAAGGGLVRASSELSPARFWHQQLLARRQADGESPHHPVTVDAFRVGIQDYVTCLELLPTVLEDEAVAKAFFKTELGILLLRVKWELFARYW